jgi:hypothetical protein
MLKCLQIAYNKGLHMLELPARIMTDATAIKRFVTAGRARITLRSAKTGIRYTYRIQRVHADLDRFFVQLMDGPDNENDFNYIGTMEKNVFRLTKKSKLPMASNPVAAFNYFCEKVMNKEEVPYQLEVRHEGRCGRCGRPLTVPESIDRGIGPECWGKLGK